MFVLHPQHQGRGYGAEVVRRRLAELDELGLYEAVWLRVYLKNRGALRFWIRCGFTEIVQRDGASEPGLETAASLVVASPPRKANQEPRGA